MDFCPSLRCIPVNRFLFVLGVPCLNISHRNKGISVQKPKLLTLSIPFFNEAPFQFSVSDQTTQSVCHLLFQPLRQIGEVLADTGCQTVIIMKSGNHRVVMY